MLTAYQLDVLIDPILDLYARYEQSVIEDIARRLAKSAFSSAAWQVQRLNESGLIYKRVLERLAQLTGQSESTLRAIFKRAGVKTMTFDDSVYAAAGLRPMPMNLSPAMARVLAEGIRKTAGLFQNLTLSTAIAAQDAYFRAADLAYMQVSSGSMSYDQAIKQAIRSVASEGLTTIRYPTGHKDHLDVAIRRTVLTGVGQTALQLQSVRADEMAQDLVQVSAHIGARNKGEGPENHESWQGKIYSRSGLDPKYPNFVEVTGYGTGEGLGGWNCVVGETVVSGPAIRAAYHRKYSGEIIILRTARGHELTITPNHPMLTDKGWVAAGKLKQGDIVFSLLRETLSEYKIEDFFSNAADLNPTELIEGHPCQFHGDGKLGEKTKIVYLSSGYKEGEKVEYCLNNGGHRELGEQYDRAKYLPFQRAFRRAGRYRSLAHKSRLHQLRQQTDFFFELGGVDHIPDALLCATPDIYGSLRGELRDSHSYSSEPVPYALRDALDTTAFFVRGELPGGFRSIFGCESIQSYLDYTRDLGVTQDEIVSIETRHFSGLVYNLETKEGWFSANGLITHNCRHSFYPYFDGLSESAYTAEDLKNFADARVKYNGKEMSVYDATQTQRAIERKIRYWKRQAGALEAGGIEHDGETAKVKEWQAAMRDFIRQTGLSRQYVRERVLY